MANSELYIQQGGDWRPCTDADLSSSTVKLDLSDLAGQDLPVSGNVNSTIVGYNLGDSEVAKTAANDTPVVIATPGAGKAIYITYVKGGAGGSPALSLGIALTLGNDEVLAPAIPIKCTDNTTVSMVRIAQLIYYKA